MMLTIILPVYNAEKYLGRCLNSILSQTFIDFEIILINDGSVDKSAEICKEYKDKDKRIIYIEQQNQGVAMARNKGLNEARGQYIGFVDADDYIESDMFKNLINPTLKYDLDVVLSKYKICNNNDCSISITNVPIKKVLTKNDIKENILKSYYTGGDSIVPALWNKIYKREFLNKFNLRFHNQKAVRASDYWFNLEVFQLANNSYLIPDANYCYNNEVINSIINSFRENQFNGFLESNRRLLEANKVFQFKIEYDKFYSSFYNNVNQHIIQTIKNKGYINAYEFVTKILNNKEFCSCFGFVKINKLHTKLINIFLKRKMVLFSYLVYCIWSLK